MTWTATFTATDGVETTGSVTVNAGGYTDAVGNTGGSGFDNVDDRHQEPDGLVDIVDGSLSDTDNSSVVTFTFSEVVSGFSNPT